MSGPVSTLAALVIDAAAWVAADEANDNASHSDDQAALDALIALDKLRTRIAIDTTGIKAVSRDELRDKARICIALLRSTLTGATEATEIDRSLLASMLADTSA